MESGSLTASDDSIATEEARETIDTHVSEFPKRMTKPPNPSLILPRSALGVAVVLVSMSFAGCNRVEETRVAQFEPNLVHTTKYAISEDLDMDEASSDAFWAVNKLFGTPDEPRLPDVITAEQDYEDLVSLENLQMASGPANAEGRGLYAKHCAQCHGISGNGRGPIASVQNPYPRDYRMGVFKFKSVPRGVKPTKDDIAKLLRHGIGGTAMVTIPELNDSDIDALVDYVIYLSMRGEVERAMIDGAIFDGLIEDGERVIDADLGEKLATTPHLDETFESMADADELTEEQEEAFERYEIYVESWEYTEDYVMEVADAWLEAEDEVVEVPSPPANLVVAENYEQLVSLLKSDKADALEASIARGGELFRGKVASCSKCHGANGLGDGQTSDYDDWTKDWTSRINLDPADREPLIPLLARGAMEPRNALPRNFTEGIFRGGASNEDLWYRITLGIDGSPMPAATYVDGQFEEDDIWHLINFIRSLQKAPTNPVSEEPPEQVAGELGEPVQLAVR
ncbi:MAG: c-type cytochrome [Planctomycetota bacterium]